MSRKVVLFGVSFLMIVLARSGVVIGCGVRGDCIATDAPCDRSAIAWFKPGEFEAAQAKAKAASRLLVLKGISFGIDDAGAACATRGRW